MMRALVLALLLATPAYAQDYTLRTVSPRAVLDENGVVLRTEASAELVIDFGGPFPASLTFGGVGTTDLGAELAALRLAKNRLRAAVALIDAIALEHIGEVLP